MPGLVCTDDINILEGSVYTIKKNTDALVIGSKEIRLEVKYMVISRDQDAGRVAV